MSYKSCNATCTFIRKFKTRCIGEVLARYKDQLELKTTRLKKLRAETFLLFANVVKVFEVVQVPGRPPCLDGTMAILVTTRPSANYAKDWLDHSFPFPGLVWPEKEFYFGCDH